MVEQMQTLQEDAILTILKHIYSWDEESEEDEESEQGEEDNEEDQNMERVLIFQKQEEATSMSGNPGSRGERDPTVGHFCAPFCPGFCEANLCIFHTSN